MLQNCNTACVFLSTHYLFLCVFVGAEEVDGLHVSEVDVMAQEEDEEQLADILFFAVAV